MNRNGRIRDMVSTRLVLFVLLPTAAVLLTGGIGTLVALETRFERQLQQEVAMVARSLQEPVSHAFERDRAGSLRSALSSALTIGRIHSANVFDDEGELLATMGPSDVSVDREILRRFVRRRRGGGTYALAQGEPVFAYFVPIRLEPGTDRAGLLQVTRRRDDIDARMARLRRDGVIGFVGLMVALGLLVVIGYRRAIGAALTEMRASIARIAAGDVTHRAPVGGPLEVSRLADGFNRMLDALQAAEVAVHSERERRAQLQLRLAASERLAALGQLAGGIAHELGTPLAAASGRIQRARRLPTVPDDAERELSRAARELSRVERIVSDVLSFGRSGGGRRRRVSLSHVVSRALDVVRSESAGSRVEWVVCGEDLVALSVDPPRLELAIANLCRNAAQMDGVTRVVIDWRRAGDDVVVTVTDDGPGVDPALRDRVFHPFFTTRATGTGLGLAIVASVAREHDGVAATEPASEGGGACFSLRMPLTSEVDRES